MPKAEYPVWEGGSCSGTMCGDHDHSMILAKELRGRDITVNTVAPGDGDMRLYLEQLARLRLAPEDTDDPRCAALEVLSNDSQADAGGSSGNDGYFTCKGNFHGHDRLSIIVG